MSRAAKIARLVAVLGAVANFAVLLWLFARRLRYPYDLEWMEGGMLCHALRLVHGQPLYAPPSADFIPFLYTPLYPALLAALAKITPGGVGYVMGRLVSILSFAGATVLGWRFAARHGGSRAAATVGMALPAAAWVATGAWYDIARPDSLWLLLVTAALVLVYQAARTDGDTRRASTDWRGHALAAAAGALMVAAFLTKQIAFPLMVTGGLALLALHWRLAFAYGGTMALLGLPSLWLIDRASAGWFWTYIFKLHQSHSELPFFRAWIVSPWLLIKMVGPALLLLPWALVRRRSPAVVYSVFLAVAGGYTACLSFKTQWAFINAFIPGVFFAALAIATCAGALVTPGRGRSMTPVNLGGAPPAPRLRPVAVYLLGLASLVLHPFDPRPFVPAASDRAAGDRLLARMRATDGDVLIPFHPFYGHLAGKPTFVHRMGVMDVANSLGTPKGLAEGIRTHRWQLVVLDYKIEGTWFQWPGLLEHYATVEKIAGPRTFTGAPTAPLYLMTPRGPIDRELQ